jgi:dethiobiotin synthetase
VLKENGYMSNAIFITGIGTNVGKTIVAAILAEALEADYWKPVQAGYNEGTDAEFVRRIISNKKSVIHRETYKFKLAASPHIASREEGIKIELDKIHKDFLEIINNQQSIINNQQLTSNLKLYRLNDTVGQGISTLIIEGAGGLMVPLNEHEFVLDLIKKLNAKVILVSRNYLGSINHSLLTAAVCKENNLNVLGWIFNDHYMNYEEEIVQWSGYPKIASIPFCEKIDDIFILEQAVKLKKAFASYL